MQKYFYIVILSLIFMVACSESDDTIATSSETRVNMFSFQKDTANMGLSEATYIIEHLSDTGRIYCKDSLRFGTRLDSVVPYITYKATPASAQYVLPDTTIISTGSDTLDFTKNPIYLYVQSSDLKHERWYRIDIYAHQADPDLYVWEELTEEIFAPQNCEMKAFYNVEKIVLYVNNGFQIQVYHSINGQFWQKTHSPTGLPKHCSVRDIMQYNDTLYYADGDKLYTTTDWTEWTATDFADRTYALVNMLVVFDNMPWCILQDRTTQDLFLGTICNGNVQPAESIYGLTNNILPKDFPVSDFASLTFQSSSERPRAMIVGGRTINGTPVNTRWNIEYESSAGYRLVDFSIEQPSFNSLTGISIIQYNNQLLMFGGIDNDQTWRSDMLYSVDEGMNWHVPDTTHNKLPDSYQSRQNQTVVVDKNNNIYIIGGQSNTQTFSNVFRGYLNSLKW